MAQKTIVYLVDDLDNQELDGDGQTVTFGLDRAQYEIDLSGDNACRLHEALAPFIAAGRRVGGRSKAGASTTVQADARQLQAMRQWAKDNGLKVSDRGPISKEVREAYRAAK